MGEHLEGSSVGQIAACQCAGCNFRCCDFSAGNYIALYPGELNQAVASGASLDHLEIRPSDDGGHRAICHACDTSSCDRGYKPLDCASYPFFPTLNPENHAIEAGLVSPKCPLVSATLHRHAAWVVEKWRALATYSANVQKWMQCVTLVGYRRRTALAEHKPQKMATSS